MFEKRLGKGFLIVLGLLWVLAGAGALAEPAPRVGIRFDWQAEFFLFDAEAREAIAFDAVTELVRLLQERGHRGFPEWIQAEGDDGAFDAEWIFRLGQVEDTITSESEEIPVWQIFIEHIARVNGVEVELPLTREDALLYDIGDIIPRTHSQKLSRRIGEALEDQVEDDFLTEVNQSLIQNLTLSDNVVLDPENKQVIIPLRLGDLQASSASLIGVELAKNGLTYGTVVLKAASQVVEGEFFGSILGRVTEMEVPPFDFQLPVWWHEDLPRVFGGADSHRVYMYEYRADLSGGTASDDGVVLEPDS